MGRAEESRTLFWSESTDERKLTTAFCAMLLERIRAGDFLGPGVEVTLNSDFDSICHAVDLVLEFPTADPRAMHLGLSVEVAYPAAEPWDPFDETRAEIDRDELAEVKYFESREGWLKLELPRAHVLVDVASVGGMLQPWLDGVLQLKGGMEQRLIVRSIATQLAAYSTYAEANGRSHAREELRRVSAEVSQRIESMPAPDGDEDGGQTGARLQELHERLRGLFCRAPDETEESESLLDN